MNKDIKLAIIGMSPGNGHPYSWSAICNGYEPKEMEKCPFPVIPKYLSKQKWPESSISNVTISHIWTQNLKISDHIAKSTFIPNIVENLESLIDQVDGVLLARDDSENHLEMAKPFLKAGLPIFIDKPFAYNLKDANAMLELQKYNNQIFTCSATRFSDDLLLSSGEHRKIGRVNYVEGSIQKSWDKYSVHLIEPIVRSIKDRGDLIDVIPIKNNSITKVQIKWSNLSGIISSYGNYNVPMEIKYFGKSKMVIKNMNDTFSSFKKSLSIFIKNINDKSNIIPRSETLEIVKIIEQGNSGA